MANEEDVRRLAREVHEKRERYYAMGMMNTAHLDYEDRAKQSEDYAVAMAEFMAAESALRQAQSAFAEVVARAAQKRRG